MGINKVADISLVVSFTASVLGLSIENVNQYATLIFIIVSIISVLIGLIGKVASIVIKILKKWKEAKADGKVTIEEGIEIAQIAQTEAEVLAEDTASKINDIKKGKE